ncbi:Aromatic ring-opening dioxygenase, catalytic subunit, LigB family [Collimonas sp. OK607]|uniref:dioxygenase family protein n=1 Tax=Collimonas sp. OK607 TaxID=1798194 RepID=UPI0008F033A7|nr:class III extradiol ring-cleavage dioxygenase [Collimonas sp. OK607]SFB21048.1 Aromatic ring-opening dioxygenase, catalytic subunit, LigB family [Collimonas sp. OK607]
MTTLPTIFVSHGSPMLALQDSPARRFLQGLGNTLPKPKAILMVSAHWETAGGAAVSLAAQPATIYDFGGFPQALYDIKYHAPGAPEVAERAAALFEGAGVAVVRSAQRGLDHGAWVPLSLMYPDADVPVAQISLVHGATPAAHEKLGEALAQLRAEGVLIIGSGSLTHNLYEFRGQRVNAPAPQWVTEFEIWMKEHLEAGDRVGLLNYRQLAPSAVQNHPSEEHLLPLFVALGAAGPEAQARLLHSSVEHGVLAMDAYAFN